MRLIADSGSTKTDWCFVDGRSVVRRVAGQGINPYQQSVGEIERVVAEELLRDGGLAAQVGVVEFYGAGWRRSA